MKSDQVLVTIARLSGREAATLERKEDLVVDLGMDSPAALELLVEIEGLLDLEISDEEASRLHSVGDILGYVETHERADASGGAPSAASTAS